MRTYTNPWLACAIASLTPLLSLTAPSQAEEINLSELRQTALEATGILPDKMPGAENDSKAQIKLGESLYFDTRLSINNSQSCNSCHRVDKNGGGVDNEPTSPGAFGKRGDRNSPTTLNAGFHMAQFWDGRAEDLVAQAKGPVLNPVEMAMPSEPEVIKRLTADKDYAKMFKKAFPQDANPITYDNVARAIAAFERTLVTHDRYNDFLKGKDKALTPEEQQGLQTFLTVGCTTCHNGPLLGGNSYQKVGLVNPYPSEDPGRFNVTKDEADKQKFKVPSLRNIAITHPYFHDGKMKTLEETIQSMGHLQLGLDLSKDQINSIAAFLNTLTDKKRAK